MRPTSATCRSTSALMYEARPSGERPGSAKSSGSELRSISRPSSAHFSRVMDASACSGSAESPSRPSGAVPRAVLLSMKNDIDKALATVDDRVYGILERSTSSADAQDADAHS